MTPIYDQLLTLSDDLRKSRCCSIFICKLKNLEDLLWVHKGECVHYSDLWQHCVGMAPPRAVYLDPFVQSIWTLMVSEWREGERSNQDALCVEGLPASFSNVAAPCLERPPVSQEPA